jgi:hypothetical protein
MKILRSGDGLRNLRLGIRILRGVLGVLVLGARRFCDLGFGFRIGSGVLCIAVQDWGLLKFALEACGVFCLVYDVDNILLNSNELCILYTCQILPSSLAIGILMCGLSESFS